MKFLLFYLNENEFFSVERILILKLEIEAYEILNNLNKKLKN
jgi:hypothetical protein